MKSLLFLILLTQPVLADECFIISDGSLWNFIHEKGHCNGWRHPPFTNASLPPIEYIHDFDGAMFVTVTNGNDTLDIKAVAQRGASVSSSTADAVTLCTTLWHKYHVPVPDNAAGMASLVGCAVTLDDKGFVK